MNEKLTTWAAAVVLSIGAAAPALGASVTRPGDTIGLAVGKALPEGLYLANNATQECRNTSPKDRVTSSTPPFGLVHPLDDFRWTSATDLWACGSD